MSQTILVGSHRRLRKLQLAAMLLAAVAVLGMVDSSAQAQRRPRGERAADAAPAATSRGGYGSSNSSNASGTGRTAGTPAKAAAYPARAATAAGSSPAEYQKPSYDHYRLAVSPDGTKLVVSGRRIEKETHAAKGKTDETAKSDSAKAASKADVLEVIDLASGRAIAGFNPPAVFENLALSVDNRFLAAESTDRPGVVNVLHLPTGKSKEFKTELRRIIPGGIVFSSDGRTIHVVAPDRLLSIALADGQTKELKYEAANPAASYSALMNMVAVGASRSRRGKPEIQIYDVAGGKQIKQLEVPSGPTCLQFSPDGKWLAATIAGGAVGLWQTSDWNMVGSANGKFGYEPGQLTTSPDGGMVAIRPRAAVRDDTRIIDIKSGDVVQSVRTRDAFYLPGGAMVVTSANGPFYLDVTSGAITELPAGGGTNTGVAQTAPSSSSFGDPAAQGQNSFSTNSQPGYGSSTSQPTNSQPGYGSSAPQPANTQPGYGSSNGGPTSSQAGYGRNSPPSPQAPPTQTDRR